MREGLIENGYGQAVRRSGQEEGLIGRLVGGMIRRSVRRSFRNVYWDGDWAGLPNGPVVFVCNHHGWFDGYVMFHVVSALGKRSLDWIEEFGAFPLFRKVGGRPFPVGDAAARAKTVRETIRLMNTEGRSLVLFAEGVLHSPPDVWEFGKSLDLIARKVDGAEIVPVAIAYRMGLHERPEAYIRIGRSLGRGAAAAALAEDEVRRLLTSLDEDIRQERTFPILVDGTPSVNERWDMRRIKGGKR